MDNIEKQKQMALLHNQQGASCKALGEYDKALNHFEEAVNIYRNIYGSDRHESIALVYCAIGTIYDDINDLEQAMKYYYTAQEIHEDVCGKDDYGIARYLNNMGNVYMKWAAFDESMYNKALPLFERALELTKKKYGDDYPDTATLYDNLGYIYMLIGQHSKAYDEYLKKALDIRERVFKNEQHLDIATSYMHVGHYYSQTGNGRAALEFLKKALAVNISIYKTEDHPNIGELYGALGEISASLQDFPEALAYFKKNLSIYQRFLGENSSDTAYAYFNLGMVYHHMRNSAQAMIHYQRALDIMGVELPANHPVLENIRKHMAML